MVQSLAIKNVISALNKKDLSTADRSLLISAILDKLAAIPVSDIIYVNDKGKLFVNGREADTDEAISLRESAYKVLESKAFKLIREQVVYATFVHAVHKAVTPEDLILSKGALLWGQMENDLLTAIANNDRNGNSSHLLGDN